MTPRSLYIPHGGGPMPLLGDPGHAELIAYLKEVEPTIGRPKSIVVVSAHWEAPSPTVTASSDPGLLFDYYGFPPETYEFSYPAPGSIELVERLASVADEAGFDLRLDHERGFDHGMFVPLMLMYPDATIPVVQLSLISGLDPVLHIELGRVLRPLTDDGVLVLGSGLSFHNMGEFGLGGSELVDEENEAFDAWLERTCTSHELSEADRSASLAAWIDAPGARYNHPREEHLLPLHVCYGVGGGLATRSFDGRVLGKRVAGYQWG